MEHADIVETDAGNHVPAADADDCVKGPGLPVAARD